jgi:hypothetical protein
MRIILRVFTVLMQSITLTLEAPYTPRYDFQGISNDAEMQRIMAQLPQFTTAR